MTTAELARLNREADRVWRLTQAAAARAGESFDKPAGVRARIDATYAKHRKELDRLEAEIKKIEEATS